MKYNEILDQIYRIREEHARECGYDMGKIFARMRQRTEQFKTEGGNIVAPAAREPEPACALHDEPPKA